ncbi:sushi, von Willebrand factor type A, EGF and pentraxin domain-containing protein 1-like [Erpetoichthys calabaricus]|uniref:sushi, von Willebrand factor type A, EGF and pentraxin domain-containing protein 1-like n=1 Tax=Erpetoichthys calabaricus TaxID=27687 RepID=UPI002234A482|nr:sushi, von Willebrand factor type A, EGF and pentraxin domain-containing protein 1-like [Erpetoichthys calabaricus]
MYSSNTPSDCLEPTSSQTSSPSCEEADEHTCTTVSVFPLPCPVGTYRPESGAIDETDCTPCPAGFYQDLQGQSGCKSCPPGFFCGIQTLAPVGAVKPQLCLFGYFCPGKTEFSTKYPCPKGTLGQHQGLTSAAGCSPCPAGHFCASEGLIQPSGVCSLGFVCWMGAQEPRPSDNITGAVCTRGSYCQDGLIKGEFWRRLRVSIQRLQVNWWIPCQATLQVGVLLLQGCAMPVTTAT